ncbi:MFS transporter [Naasia lichenicola]|uniref:MFS transporter n=1 Tax=Naasia lichenicola TaxID=2565933 RepID=A0A4S4FJM8_9MICO|nr:MFS transporter [Naasia lichenicola]THG29455.1 MFS transporter [Naasia lichenicola]
MPLSVPALRYLAAAIPLRMAGEGARVALVVIAVDRADSVPLGALFVAASLAPSVIAAPLIGVALDRSRAPRRLMVVSGLITAVAFVMTGFFDPLPARLVIIALLASGATIPAFMGGLSSFAADIMPGRPADAYAQDALAYNVGGVVGPAIAAGAIAAGSSQWAIWLLAIGAAAGSAVMATMPIPARPLRTEPVSILTDVRMGLTHLVRHRPLANATLAGTLTQLGSGAIPVAAVAIALERTGGIAAAGWIVTALAIGGLAGALVSSVWSTARWQPQHVMLVGFAVTGIFSAIAAFDIGYPATLLAVGISGLTIAPAVASLLLIRREESPPEVRSQVFTVGAALRISTEAIGAGVAGIFASSGAFALMLFVAAGWLVSAAILFWYPPAGAFDAPEKVPS